MCEEEEEEGGRGNSKSVDWRRPQRKVKVKGEELQEQWSISWEHVPLQGVRTASWTAPEDVEFRLSPYFDPRYR